MQSTLTLTEICVSGTNLVKKAIYAMVEGDCDEVRFYNPNFHNVNGLHFLVCGFISQVFLLQGFF